MHRIDGPGATVDNKFTDGDPVAGIQATVVTDDWANDVQEELMSILTAASITPVKGTQNQVLAALRKINGPALGAAINGRMSITSASASGTYTADQVVAAGSLAGPTYRLTGFNKTINLGTVGAGGMDAGSSPVSGFVGIYAIYNPSNTTSALLAVNATSAVIPEVYGGANMPAGYTASALVAVVPTNVSGQMVQIKVIGRTVTIQSSSPFSTSTTTTTPTTFSIGSLIPKNAKKVAGALAVQGSSPGAAIQFALSLDATGLNGARQFCAGAVVGSQLLAPFEIMIDTPQTLWYTATVAAGAGSFAVYAAEYEF
jgi:hypothetical protein